MKLPTVPPRRGFTVIELMVVVAIVAILGMLAGPSIKDIIVMQRLRGINAQLVTDLQFARAEAISRGRNAFLNFTLTDAGETCYTIFFSPPGIPNCVCTRGAGNACNDPLQSELRTVTVPRSSFVKLDMPNDQRRAFGFDRVTGGLVSSPNDIFIPPPLSMEIYTVVDADRQLHNVVLQTGRPQVCAPNAARMGGKAC